MYIDLNALLRLERRFRFGIKLIVRTVHSPVQERSSTFDLSWDNFKKKSSDGLIVSHVVPDTSVEHSSVKVDALIPARLSESPLLVDNSLVLLVVGFQDVLPSFLAEEGVSFVGELIKAIVGLRAVSHRDAEESL